MLHKYFERVYLINLEKRKDRYEKTKEHCEEMGIKFERFPAVDGKKEKLKIERDRSSKISRYWNSSALGLLKTLQSILEKCKKENVESVLILEDDVQFQENAVKRFVNCYYSLPSYWETIFLGGNHLYKNEMEIVSDQIARTKGSLALHCHAVNRNIFDFLINKLKEEQKPADQYYAFDLHPRGHSYCIIPPLATQRPDYSDILDRNVNYYWLNH